MPHQISSSSQNRVASTQSLMAGSFDYEIVGTVDGAFLDQVAATPDAEAVVGLNATLTYRQLDEQSSQLAGRLQQSGISMGDIVAVALPRNTHWIVALLGILRAGCVYLPLNLKDPQQRLQMLTAEAAPRSVICDQDISDFFGVPAIKTADIDTVKGKLSRSHGQESPAYVMYTSGSTGKPKGVVVSHKNILRLVKAPNPIPLGPKTRVLQTGAPTFDAVTFEIWGPLLNGGTIILPSDDAILSAEKLSAEITAHQASTMWLTSPLFSQLAAERPGLFAPLAHLIVGGDVVVGRRVAEVIKACPNLVILNGYGPTENTTFSTMHEIVPDDTSDPIPIGRPLARSTAYILDNERQPVPFGHSGELYVGGDGVAIGYLNQPEQTAQSFLQDPFLPGGRMYRTGDIVRQRQDGAIEFLGRRDNQVKVRGYRVELGEIAAALRLHPDVRDAFVILHKRTDSDVVSPVLVAYVATEAQVNDLDLRSHLGRRLPAHMIPNFIILLDELPLNAHGKIARDQLPDPESLLFSNHQYVPAETPTQIEMISLIQDCLGMSGIGIDDSFYDLGIDSLSAARLASAISKQFGFELGASRILSNPSVRALALLVDTHLIQFRTNQPAGSLREDRSNTVRFGLTPQQMSIYIEQVKAPNSVRYNVPVIVDLPAAVDIDRLAVAFAQLVDYRPELRLAFPLSDPPQQEVRPCHEILIPRRVGAASSAELIRPFDLEQGPLWRVSLHDAGTHWQLFLDIHHLIADGATLALIFEELDAFYKDKPPVADPVPLSEAVQWLNHGAGVTLRQDQFAFWSKQFSAPLHRTDLPLDRSRWANALPQSAVLRFSLGSQRVRQLRQYATSRQSTVFETLCGIYGLFLSRITGQADVTFGVPAEARHENGFENTYGMLANTVCIRLHALRNLILPAFLDHARDTVRQSLENQNFTFYDLVKLVDPPKMARRNPLFDTFFALQSQSLLTVTFADHPLYLKPIPPGEPMFDLNLQLYETSDDIHAEWEYDTGLLFERTVMSLRDILVELLDNLLRSPQSALGQWSIEGFLNNRNAEIEPEPLLKFTF